MKIFLCYTGETLLGPAVGGPQPYNVKANRSSCGSQLRMKILVQIVANGIGLWVARELLAPNFQLAGGFATIALAAIVLGIIQAFARPILKIFSFPLILVTLGLFNIVISMALLWLLDFALPQLSISGVWTYVWTVALLWLANLLVTMAFPKDESNLEYTK